MTPEEKQIVLLMHTLKINEDEAKEVIEADRRIDKGEKLFELEGEAKQASKQARQAPRKPTAYNFDTSKRQRKADNEKAEVIQILTEALKAEALVKDLTISNPEREFTFVYGDRKLKIVLSAPRS